MENGISVYNLDPLTRKTRINFDEVGSVGTVEMLRRTNLIAFIAGGQSPKFSDKQLLVWDDVRKQIVLQFTCDAPVKSVRLSSENIVAVLEHKIYIYSISNPPQLIRTIDRLGNQFGLCEICPSQKRQLMAYPGNQSGQLEIMDLKTLKRQDMSVTPTIIPAHKTALRFIAFNQKGTKIATTSIKVPHALTVLYQCIICACLGNSYPCV